MNAQMGEQLLEKEDSGEPLKTRINSEQQKEITLKGKYKSSMTAPYMK